MFDDIEFDSPDYDPSIEGDVGILPTEIEDMPELCHLNIDGLESVNYSPDDVDHIGDTYHPTFGGYTKSEINAKIHEADNKIDHYKAMESDHADRATYGDNAHVEYELGRAREMHHELEKWKGIKRQWENTKPEDK